MTASRQEPSKAEQDQRDSITRMDVQMNEVVIPTMRRMDANIAAITKKDYMTRQEANDTYLTKADFKPYAVTLGVIGLGFVGGLVTAFLRVVLK